METKSRSAAGQARELENAFKELTVIYNNLNEVEKADEGGKALAASLETLRQRTIDAKSQLDAASQSLKVNEDAGKENSSMLEQLAGKFTVNIDAIKLFNLGLKASKAVLDVAKQLTNDLMAAALADGVPTVVPGFFGSYADGTVHTFSRGGSDITGAIVARAVNATVYENWTDVSGFLMADPRIVDDPREISVVTYKELRELSYMGASVLHEDAMFPVHKAGIPTNIRNTNEPTHPGTIITLNAPADSAHPTITGIAGRKGFSVVSVEKAMMNSELGFGRKVLAAFEENGVSFEHLPTGIDTMCVVVSGAALAPVRDKVLSQIVATTSPDTITVHDYMSIIATVGRGMVNNCGTAARLFSAMSKAGINVRMIDQGSSELSIIVGVDDADYESTIRAIYNAFVR